MSDQADESLSDERPDVLTQFKAGNSSWRARSTHGRKPIFANPDELRDGCEQYLAWVEDNPMIAADVVKFQGVGGLMEVPKLRAPTIRGLCVFLDIDRQTWANYREKPDFLGTCEWAEDAIYTQKVEGAAAGMLDAGFIGREIGLADRQEHEHSGAVGTGITVIEPDYVTP